MTVIQLYISAAYAEYPKQYSDLPDVIRSVSEKGFGSKLRYDDSAGEQYLLADRVRHLSGMFLGLLTGFILIAVSLQIISVSSNSLKLQEQYLAMCRAMGTKQLDLFRIMLLEHLLAAAASAVLAVLIALGFLTVSNFCFNRVFGGGISVTARQFFSLGIRIVPAAAAVYLLMIGVIFFVRQHRTIHELLR